MLNYFRDKERDKEKRREERAPQLSTNTERQVVSPPLQTTIESPPKLNKLTVKRIDKDKDNWSKIKSDDTVSHLCPRNCIIVRDHLQNQ